MHITFVSRWYPPHTGYGGVATYNYYLAHALSELGHQVTVVAARWSSIVPEFEYDDNIAVHRILALYHYWPQRIPLLGRYIRPLRQLLYSLQVSRKLLELEKENRPDVIEFAEVEAEGFVHLLRRRHLPVIVRTHMPIFILKRFTRPEEMPYDVSLTTAMERYCIRRADYLTAPSRHMALTVANECGISTDQFTVIPNPMNVSAFSDVIPLNKASETRNLNILYVGRLERNKGFQTLIDAIPSVLPEIPHARFIIIGEDCAYAPGITWHQHLRSFFQANGLESQIVLLGGVYPPALQQWYQAAHIAVVPSLHYESFSYTCAQAMAAGLPLVATRVGGIPETIGQGECGLLVEPGDAKALAGAIVRLLKNPQLRQRMGAAGYQRARQLFAADVVAKQMIELYRSVA